MLDRVLPFFSGRAATAVGAGAYTGKRTRWFLGPLAALLWAKAVFPAYAPSAAAGILVVLGRQWWGWRPWPAARTPMVGVIHVGIGWMALAWLADLVGAPPTVGIHAMLVGGIGTLLLGISMRVVRGHSGVPVVLGRAGALVMILAQLAAALRVWVGWAGGAPGLYLVSATLLVAAFVVWRPDLVGCRCGVREGRAYEPTGSSSPSARPRHLITRRASWRRTCSS